MTHGPQAHTTGQLHKCFIAPKGNSVNIVIYQQDTALLLPKMRQPSAEAGPGLCKATALDF